MKSHQWNTSKGGVRAGTRPNTDDLKHLNSVGDAGHSQNYRSAAMINHPEQQEHNVPGFIFARDSPKTSYQDMTADIDGSHPHQSIEEASSDLERNFNKPTH